MVVEKISLKKLFWIFLFASIIGAFYEEGLFVIRHLIRSGIFVWEPRRGVFWGPISPIYGIGAVVMCLLLVNKKDNLWMTFIKASLLGGVTEYIISFLQEFFLHTTSWNYSNKFLNINGRTTLPFMLVWGIFGLIFVKIIYPPLSSKIDSLEMFISDKLMFILILILSIDILISWTALIRQTLRHYHIRTITVVDRFYDKHFDDDYMKRKFPNMVKR